MMWTSTCGAAALLLASSVFARPQATPGSSATDAAGNVDTDGGGCCNALLQTSLASKVFFSSSTTYQNSIESYWSVLAQINPSCIFRPKSADDVSLAVKTLVPKKCKFAIRGGGHTPWAGAANIEKGVTFDFGSMVSTTYNPSTKLVSVDPGSRWADVYRTLDPLGIAIPGGRAGTVGVAGLTLGGGNSFFAARYGLVCDNVAKFQVVLANGTIVDATSTSNSDLWLALRGGSNNFGIVTRFDFISFTQPLLWGGVLVYPNSTAAAQVPAFVDFGNNITADPYASLIQLYQYSSANDQAIILDIVDYTKPQARPAAFKEVLAIPGVLSDDTRITNLTDLTVELEQAADIRSVFYTVTIKNDVQALQKAVEIYNQKVALAKSKAKGRFNLVFLYQPIPTLFAQRGLERGGDVLGLERFTDNLILIQVNLAYDLAADDNLFASIGQSSIDEIQSYASSIGKANEFIYLNYAYKTQNPLRSYGCNNLRKLFRIAREYDPNGVFQKLVPGGFKLSDTSCGTT